MPLRWRHGQSTALSYSFGIVSCFNSTLSGAAATTPPCGFVASNPSTGAYNVDFGFQVGNRFISVTPTSTGICNGNGVCPGLTWFVNVGNSGQPLTQAGVDFVDISYTRVNATFQMFVY